MSTIETSARGQPSAPVPGVLPSFNRPMPKTVAFWLMAVIFALLLFSSGAPTPLYGFYQAEWHFSPSVLTIVFGVYGLGVLSALVAFGALSDRIGRRPVMIGSLITVIVSMVLFIAARGVDWLIAARLVQGLAVGAAATAASAAMIELEPDGKPGLGALAGATAPSFGLAGGTLLTGVSVDYGPAPSVAIYAALVVVFVLAVVAVMLMPETSGQGGQVPHVWRPRRITVPRDLRKRFTLLSIGTAATWAIGGFYLSLGPSLAAELLHNQQRTVGGVVAFTLVGLGAFSTLLLSGWSNRRAGYFGSACMVIGLATVLYAVSAESTVLFFAGSIVLGTGWGPSYMAAFRAIAALAPPQHKSEILAAVYVVNYLFFSLPAIAAGIVATHFGLHTATLAFGGVVICMAAIAGFGVHAAEGSLASKADATKPAKPEPCCVPCTVPHLVDCGK